MMCLPRLHLGSLGSTYPVALPVLIVTFEIELFVDWDWAKLTMRKRY